MPTSDTITLLQGFFLGVGATSVVVASVVVLRELQNHMGPSIKIPTEEPRPEAKKIALPELPHHPVSAYKPRPEPLVRPGQIAKTEKLPSYLLDH